MNTPLSRNASNQSVETYLVSQKNVVAPHAVIQDPVTGNTKHAHPDYASFTWLENILEKKKFMQLELSLHRSTSGTKNVIAIFEDHSYKIFRNVKRDFIPSIADKTKTHFT